jgi:peptidoglycan hydrolase-like protein with peptidoglycan-binding domain
VVPINNVRFNAKQNGFLVDAEITKNIISITQKTNTPLPNSEEVWFGNRGNTVVYRSWDALKRTIVSFSGSLPSLNTLNYCQKPFTTLLKTKSKGDEVKELQKYINVKLSLNLTIDGIYGKKISDAVKPLQKILSLPESGSYDQSLIDAINADCTNIIATRTQSLSGIQKITGDFMPEGILRGTVSPDGTQVFYLKPTLTGVVGMISTITGKNERQVFSSPLTEWKPQWINDTTITMTTLPSSEADGYLYFLNPVTGDFQKILGPVRGLTTLSNPSGTTLLLSSTANKTISLATYTVATGVQTPRDLNTLTDKCVWQNDTIVVCAVPQKLTTGQYPDDWYQGNISFADAFWSIDTTQNTTLNLFTPGEAFDAYRLVLSPDANYLYFINRLNGSLWSYRIGEE